MRQVAFLSHDANRRTFRNIKKADEMRRGIAEYLDQMRAQLNTRFKPEQTWNRESFEGFLSGFQRLSKNSRYLTRLTSLLIAGAGLGILVPKTQYALTRLITGKNEHPGIASVAHQNGVQTLVDPSNRFGATQPLQAPTVFQQFS